MDPGLAFKPALDLGLNPPEDAGLFPPALLGRLFEGLLAKSARSWFTLSSEGGGGRGTSLSTRGAREERLCAEAECLSFRSNFRPLLSAELWLGECFPVFGEFEADEEREVTASFAEPRDRREEIRFLGLTCGGSSIDIFDRCLVLPLSVAK